MQAVNYKSFWKLSVLISIVLVCKHVDAETMTPPFSVDYGEFISQHDVLFDAPITVSTGRFANFIDGAMLGNGDVGAVFHGSGDNLLLSVGKNDVWNRVEVPPLREPITQKEFVDMVLHGKNGGLEKLIEIDKNELHVPYNNETYPCPKPVGQIIFSNRRLAGADFQQRLCVYDALVESNFKNDKNNATLSTFTSYQENLILTRYSYNGNEPLELTVDLLRLDDNAKEPWTKELKPMPMKPVFGQDGKFFWVRYRFPAEAMFPDGFEYVMFGVVKGGRYETSLADHRARAVIKGDKSDTIEIYVGVATSRDAKDPFVQAKRIVKTAMNKGFEQVLAKHKSHWHNYWSKSFIDMSDDFMEKMWYLNRYFLACCSKKGKVAPGLYGNWITTDVSPWHGDYHYNYNFMQTYWGVYACNTPELAWPYYDYTYRILPMAKKEAREIYDMRGAMYPLTGYPNAMERNPYPCFPWSRCMCLGAWAAQNFWWHYIYTLDDKFLRERAYPVMVECARFYQDFMKKEDGKYVIWPTVSPEHWRITEKFKYNRNCTIDLALIKFLLKGTIEASEILNRDEKDRAVWRDMAANMADYPTLQTETGKIFVDVENAPPITYNVPVPIGPVVPGDDIGLHSDTEMYELAKNTAEQIEINGNDGFVILPMAWMRLGLKDKYELLRQWCQLRFQKNGILNMYPNFRNAAPVVENFGFTAVVNEMLMQSFNGKIRVFPALPDNHSARFVNLRTVGAFLVASEIDKGQVGYIRVKSLKGRPCTIYNPWPGKVVRVTHLNTGKLIESRVEAGEISFNTNTGKEYLLELTD